MDGCFVKSSLLALDLTYAYILSRNSLGNYSIGHLLPSSSMHTNVIRVSNKTVSLSSLIIKLLEK